MEQTKATGRRPQQRGTRRRAGDGLRAGFAALSIAGLCTACLAADSISSLGSAFRPQAGAFAAVQGSSERSDANLSGLRVVVSSPTRSVASIDGQIVRVGDVVDGMRVTRIDPQGVVLTGEDGVQERLAIHPSVVKRMTPVNAGRITNGAGQ